MQKHSQPRGPSPTGRTERRYANRLEYRFEYLDDGWIAIYELRAGLPPKPLIQACDEEKAMEFIALREPLPIPAQPLVPR